MQKSECRMQNEEKKLADDGLHSAFCILHYAFFPGSVAFVIALLVDYPIAHAVHTSGLGHFVKGKWWAQVLKEPGEIQFTIAIAVLLLVCRRINWKMGLFVLLSGVLSGANVVVKWLVGRSRPYKLPGSEELKPFEVHPFWHGAWGFTHQSDLCFPSGHECTAGALAVAVCIAWPRGRWIFIALAVLVGIERVAENAHYASNVIGAMGFAMLGTSLLYHILAGWLRPATRPGFEVIVNSPEAST